ncbi:DNA polymerase epsilon subunit 2 [Diorhabda carinulata]|uniref:DNA polymerase epsilon subunit 2 n=1 Tax=Diorhabda carinulata TaxID=1163345 RepID=UPI0025A20EE5|nr:DNA polymerase epsilon subunit 2 [Diorhabda carinulata]
MANDERIKKKLQNAFKLSGFNVRREFCDLIIKKFKEERMDLSDNLTFDTIITNLCNSLENQCLLEKSIEIENIERAIKVCLHHGYDNNESIFNVIDAFDFPKFTYNPDRKQYYIENNKSTILPDADVKSKLFLERYTTVLQRTKRNFQQKGEKDLKLQTVDYLLTVSSITLDRTLILGALFQISEGKWSLEDPTGIVELNLTHAKYHAGFFNENCLVLVNGYYEDPILHVSSIVLPPGEDYKSSRPTFGNINYFGGSSIEPLRNSLRLKEYMSQNKHKFMLFFSDVWLDHPQVFEKLECLFNGFQDCPPIAFIFMGNFMSNSHGSEMMDTLKKLFKRLADLITNFPGVSNDSQFVFVPGMADPCFTHIAPRFALPSYVTGDMKKVLPKAIFTTNPCRIQYCTRELTLFRADLMPKLLQGTLHKPSKDEIPDCIRRTIISQGHLSPLSLNSLTVQWDYDYCLRLYPLPDVVVIGDKCEAYEGSNKDCHVINPGPFCENGFQFLSYLPYTNTIEDCAL